MATGGEHVSAAAVEVEHGEAAELLAPTGWTKKVNTIRGGKFEVVFVSPDNKEIKSKRALTQYLNAHGGPASSEFNWGTGCTPRRSSRISEKVKATESPEDEKAPKRERSASSKKGKKGKQEDAVDAPVEIGDHTKEEKTTDIEMKEADDPQEEKKEADNTQEEKIVAPDTDTAEKIEGERKAEVSELPSEVLASVSEDKGDEKLAKSEVTPVEGIKDENGLTIESAVPPFSSQENKEEAGSTINPVTPPPVETKVGVPAADAAKDAENSADNSAHKDDQMNGEQSPVNCDKGQIQPGASTVKCT